MQFYFISVYSIITSSVPEPHYSDAPYFHMAVVASLFHRIKYDAHPRMQRTHKNHTNNDHVNDTMVISCLC